MEYDKGIQAAYSEYEHLPQQWVYKSIIIIITNQLYSRIKEAHEKEFACIRKETFVNMRTIHDLAVRLRHSRETPAFLAQYFMSVLPASLKEPDMINQLMFDDLLLPLSVCVVYNEMMK